MARALRKGELRAWEAFCALYASPLYRFVLGRLGGHGAHAEDVTQNALVDAIESIKRFDPAKGSLWNWLCGIAVHKAADEVRRNTREARALENLNEVVQSSDEVVFEPGGVPTVEAIFSLLNPRHQQVLQLKYIDGLAVREAAKRMKVTEKTVESRLTRAREAYRREYARLADGKEVSSDG